MNDLFSAKVTNEMILKSFDSLYSVLKEADLIKKSSISREPLENGNYKLNLEIEFEPPVGRAEGEKFHVSSGDVIKIEPTK